MTFNPVDHTYWEGDKQLPSVTTILKEAGHIDTTWYKKSGTMRGTAVHEATEAIDRGELELGDFEGEEIFPFLKAYDRFKQDTGIVYSGIELQVSHPHLVYAGTLDRIGAINGDEYLIDIKTGAGKSFWHGLQLAAYEACVGHMRKRILFLRKTGTYALVDSWKHIKFSNPMWADYWAAIATQKMYDLEYKK